MHIVQILPELNQGGVERGTVELNRELVKRGHRSTVISAGGSQSAQIKKDGGQHITLDVCSKNPLTFPFRAFALRRTFRKLMHEPSQGSEVRGQRSEDKRRKTEGGGQPPTAHLNPQSYADGRRSTGVKNKSAMLIHARSRVPAWLCQFANKTLKIPFVTTVHGFNSVSKYSAIMTRGDAVICVSNPIKKYIQQNYSTPDKKITVIHRGVDPTEFNPERVDHGWIDSFKEKHELNGKHIITAVGRITELKDYETFIRAIAACTEAIPNICGVIVGGVRHDKQAYFERLQELVKELGAEEQIIFAGSQSQMAEVYALSDLLISCSKKPESFGRTLIEAMAMNTPVIASAHGGPLDILIDGENGFLFEAGNDRELAEKIDQALQFKFSNLRKHIEDNFSLNRMTEDELAVYRALV